MDVMRDLLLEFKRNCPKEDFSYHKECEGLINYVIHNMTKSHLPDVEPQQKNDEESRKYREEGNYIFAAGNNMKAIELYSKSLAYAKSNLMMSNARANRSAALYRKKFYIECIVDINAALTMDYPADKVGKLRERGQKALNRIKEMLLVSDQDDSSELLKLFEQYEKRGEVLDPLRMKKENVTLEGKDEDEKKEEKELGILKDLKIEEKKKKSDNVGIFAVSGLAPDPKYLADEGRPVLTYGPSNEAPALSKGLKITYSQKYGRHVVATKEFKPGDVVAVEEPFAHVLYIHKWYTHCHQCLTRNYNLIPCPYCPIAMYCSEKCRDIAWKIAHSTECKVLSVLASLLNVNQDKINHVEKIMRVMIVMSENGRSLEKLKTEVANWPVCTDRRTAGFTDSGRLESSTRSALSLATNFETRPLGDISALACIASLTAILLATQSNFFGKTFSNSRLTEIKDDPNIKFFSTLMLRSIVIMSSNSFSVQIEPGNKCGSGLYITQSLFNHACTPNTMRHFDGLTMISRALLPIAPGEQVFTSYCGGYQFLSKEERRKKTLEDYYFECDCQACTEDWPLYNEVMAKHIGTVANNPELSQKLEPFRARIRNNKFDVEAIKSAIELLHREAKMPCEELYNAVQYLKSYYLGNFHKRECSELKN